jgi:hypothetical protein
MTKEEMKEKIDTIIFRYMEDISEIACGKTDDYAILERDFDSLKSDLLGLHFSEVVSVSTEEDYEPYFGWCDVKDCKNEGCGGGVGWRETGYWVLCSFHADQESKGLPQPEMKQSAIDRENTRDPITGCLRK